MGVFLCPFALALFPRLPYNVAMKDKELKVKVDDEFIEKVDYLQRINDYKNRSDTVRKVVEKEYRREHEISNGFYTTYYPRGKEYCEDCRWLNTSECKVAGVGFGDEVRCTGDGASIGS